MDMKPTKKAQNFVRKQPDGTQDRAGVPHCRNLCKPGVPHQLVPISLTRDEGGVGPFLVQEKRTGLLLRTNK